MLSIRPVLVLLAALALAAASRAQGVPSYDALFLGPAQSVTGLSENGLVIGQAAAGSATRGWVASAGSPLQLLPLAPGDQSSWANDVNELGVVVGAVSTSTSPEFGGRAAAWYPDGQGGYLLQELGSLPGHTGSIATAVDIQGDVVGHSVSGMFRYAVWFNSPAGVLDLNPLGVFDPQSLNDQRQFCDRTGRRMDLDTMIVEVLTLPAGPPSYQAALGYSINDAGDVAGTLVLATSTSCVYQAARYLDGLGWQALTPCSPLAAASDINDRGDVLYTAFLIYGILHLEGLGEYDVQDLLAPGSADWDVLTSFHMDINDARQMAVMATHTVTGQTGALLLTPREICQADLGLGGPGDARLTICGGDLSTGTTVDLRLTDAVPGKLMFVFAGFQFGPAPLLGGQLVPFPFEIMEPFLLDAAGELWVPGIAGGGGPASLYVQCLYEDPGQALGVGFSNAVRMDFLP